MKPLYLHAFMFQHFRDLWDFSLYFSWQTVGRKSERDEDDMHLHDQHI